MLIILFIVKKYLHARNGSKQFGVLCHEENFENFLALNVYTTPAFREPPPNRSEYEILILKSMQNSIGTSMLHTEIIIHL